MWVSRCARLVGPAVVDAEQICHPQAALMRQRLNSRSGDELDWERLAELVRRLGDEVAIEATSWPTKHLQGR